MRILPPSVTLALCALTVASSAAAQTPRAGTVAFTNVTVIPMDRERTLANQTVVVRDGLITHVGSAESIRVPAEAMRVEGRGKFLLPGLAEMHAHIPGANSPEQLVHDIMFLYVANGITTIRGMLGAPNQLALRERTREGDVLGPTIYVGAPSLNGNSAPTPEIAARLVREHKAAGYDLLKLHPGLSREVYDAIVATARAVDITFAGHVSAGVGIEHTLASRQSTVDHLDGYVEGAASEAVRSRMGDGPVPLADVVRSVDDARIRMLAERTRAAGVWNVPTVFLWESFYSPETPESMAARPEMRYAPPQMLAGWIQQKRNQTQSQRNSGVSPEDALLYLQARRRILKALSDAGAGLLMGTDSPQMFNVPGFSLHREVALMAEVGLTPYQVLESGTRNIATYAAKDLKLDGNFGTVAVGNRADLILLDANPLEDLRNLARRSGVMVRGRWLPASEIDRRLEDLARRNAARE